MEQTTESVETVEYDPSSVDSVDDAINSNTPDIDAMSDEEFEQHFDGEAINEETEEATEEPTEEVEEPVDLDALYSAQLDDKESKLDKPLYIKVDGQVFSMDSIDELRNMAERGTSATRKFQKLAEDRKQLEAQLKELGQEPQVDDNVTDNEVNSVAEAILSSSYAENFKSDMSSMPDEVRSELANNASMLQGLAGDYESGLAQKIMPQVTRLMKVNGMSFQEAYFNTGKTHMNTKQETEARTKTIASQPRPTQQTHKTLDVDSMSDEAFDKYFENM